MYMYIYTHTHWFILYVCILLEWMSGVYIIVSESATRVDVERQMIFTTRPIIVWLSRFPGSEFHWCI